MANKLFSFESPELDESPEATAEQTLRQRVRLLESELQYAHVQIRQLRKQLTRAQAVLGIEDGERAA